MELDNANPYPEVSLLAECLLDEPLISQPLAARALRIIVLCTSSELLLNKLAHSKYGHTLHEVMWLELSGGKKRLATLTDEWMNLRRGEVFSENSDVLETIERLLESSDVRDHALGLMSLTRIGRVAERLRAAGNLDKISSCVREALGGFEIWRQFCGARAVSTEPDIIEDKDREEVVYRLIDIWSMSEVEDLWKIAGLALVGMPRVARGVRCAKPALLGRIGESVALAFRSSDYVIDAEAALVSAYRYRQPWSDRELSEKILMVVEQRRIYFGREYWKPLSGLARSLGSEGEVALRKLEQMQVEALKEWRIGAAPR